MTKQEQVKAIFIEEAGEIIEKLDVNIIRFEEDSSDLDLLNEIFRGVHTLKGNANAFGFTRLGEFVHHFEDVLDYYRSTKEVIEPEQLELFVTGVDVIQDVMHCELEGIASLPASYAPCLEQIIALLDLKKSGEAAPVTEAPTAPMNDLASEFALSCPEQLEKGVEKKVQEHQGTPSDALNLFIIDLTLDEDCFKRGFDYISFIRMLSEKATSMESFFNCESVPTLDGFSVNKNSISKVTIVALTPQTEAEVEEYVEYLFDHEYTILLLPPAEPKAKVVVEEVQVQAPKAAAGNDSRTSMSSKSTIRIDTNKLDELFDSVGELVIAQNFIAQNEQIRLIENESINRTIETLSKITKNIQDRVMGLRMVAIKDTFEKMKRVIRDTSKKTGKEVQLIVQGEETEIDKTMIDSLADPMIHIIRNAIDHGLEANANERIKAGKPAEGKLTLKAFHKSGNIVISVSDDGRGINKERVLAKAIERGVVTGEENLTDAQIFGLIMQPGFSTAESISDLSGRGVGLDVVKTSIEKLRGKIEIDSVEGKGTTFSMILPLTLAIIDGMLVHAGEETYIIPTLSVVESFRPEKELIHVLKEKDEFVSLRGQYIPVVRLSDVFELDAPRIEPWEGILVCVETEAGRIALLVNELVGRQQVVIKTLGKTLNRLKEVSGGAILGNGDIALILNVDEIKPAVAEVPHARD